MKFDITSRQKFYTSFVDFPEDEEILHGIEKLLFFNITDPLNFDEIFLCLKNTFLFFQKLREKDFTPLFSPEGEKIFTEIYEKVTNIQRLLLSQRNFGKNKILSKYSSEIEESMIRIFILVKDQKRIYEEKKSMSFEAFLKCDEKF